MRTLKEVTKPNLGSSLLPWNGCRTTCKRKRYANTAPTVPVRSTNFSKGSKCVARKWVAGHKFREQGIERHLSILEGKGRAGGHTYLPLIIRFFLT